MINVYRFVSLILLVLLSMANIYAYAGAEKVYAYIEVHKATVLADSHPKFTAQIVRASPDEIEEINTNCIINIDEQKPLCMFKKDYPIQKVYNLSYYYRLRLNILYTCVHYIWFEPKDDKHHYKGMRILRGKPKVLRVEYINWGSEIPLIVKDLCH